MDRDVRAEAFMKAVGFWLVAVSMFLVLGWIAFPMIWHVRARDQAVGWVFILFFSALLFWLGRSLYRLGDGARILLAGFSFLGSFLTGFVVLVNLTVVFRRFEPEHYLFAVNAVLWAAIGVQMVQTSVERVCSRGYRDQFATARPVARFYASIWFWGLFLVHGALIAYLTYSVWQSALD